MALYDYGCMIDHVHEEKFPIGKAPDSVLCGVGGCYERADRMLATGTTVFVNKVMSPWSKRVKPSHIGR